MHDNKGIGGYLDLLETGRLGTHLVFTRRFFLVFEYYCSNNQI